MPVEIKEMVIKGIVTKGKSPKKDDAVHSGDKIQYGPSGDAESKEAKSDKPISSLSYGLKRQIVKECMQEVMDALNRRLDR
jgi:hypothetical protein